jgi:hypothetical protein
MDITLLPDCKEFLRLLNMHGVEYLLIDGYVVQPYYIILDKLSRILRNG